MDVANIAGACMYGVKMSRSTKKFTRPPQRPALEGDDDDDGNDDDGDDEDPCRELWLVVGSAPSMHSINPHLPARHSQSITQ